MTNVFVNASSSAMGIFVKKIKGMDQAPQEWGGAKDPQPFPCAVPGINSRLRWVRVLHFDFHVILRSKHDGGADSTGRSCDRKGGLCITGARHIQDLQGELQIHTAERALDPRSRGIIFNSQGDCVSFPDAAGVPRKRESTLVLYKKQRNKQ